MNFRLQSVHINQIGTSTEGEFVWVEDSVPPEWGEKELHWFSEIVPQRKLLGWYALYPDRWYEFARLFRLQLRKQTSKCERLRQMAQKSQLNLVYQQGTQKQNIATVLEGYVIELECQRRWESGLMIGGYTKPVREQILALGGLWFTKHKTWMMPDESSWKAIVDLLPGDF
ncbi:MAG: DUF488 family protein [bacterium]|nr:DUF488 family protein [bacterium]